jgi:hypothetical protein
VQVLTSIIQHSEKLSESTNSPPDARIMELTDRYLGVTYNPIWGQFGRKCVLSLRPSDIQISKGPERQQDQFTHIADAQQEQRTVADRLHCEFEIPDIAGFTAHYASSDALQVSRSRDSQLYMAQHITAEARVRRLSPRLSLEMLGVICQLPPWSAESEHQYHEFFANYGTHVVLRLALDGNLRIVTRGLQDTKNILILRDGGGSIASQLTSVLENHFRHHQSPYSWPEADVRMKWIKALETDPTFCPDNASTQYRWLHTLGGLTPAQEHALRQASKSYLQMRHRRRHPGPSTLEIMPATTKKSSLIKEISNTAVKNLTNRFLGKRKAAKRWGNTTQSEDDD